MRILALSDIHGAYKIAKKILGLESAIDVVVMAGDLTTRGNRTEALDAILDLKSASSRLLAVAGNMDSTEIDDSFLKEGLGINGKGRVIQDIGFFGVSGGTKSILHTPFELTEEEIASIALQGWEHVADARVKVFVPHTPPHGTKLDIIRLGNHVGSSAVREFVEAHQPDLLICGHIHESSGEDFIGRTKMVNCGSVRDGRYAVVEVGESITLWLKELDRGQ
jgi:uncharacterized protein